MSAARSPRGRASKGQNIVVRYDAARCIHAAECVKRQPGVFDPKRRPWIDPDAGDPDEIAAAIAHCPTGALHFERLDEGAAETVVPETTVVVQADGPLYVQGDLRIADQPDEQDMAEVRAAFCRCGASENKPYCDGRHAKIEFRDPAALPEDAGADQAMADFGKGPVRFTLAPNGPLLVEGGCALKSEDGSSERYLERGALCRCGQSSRKPLCDGSHVAAGFEG
jgi:CDGSH-type Zn-finger protein/uncharacterized Fe-S cluster protein YjdI